MLLLVFDVDHLFAVAAFADVAAAVGLVEVDAVRGEGLVAVAALLRLGLHFSYYSNYCFSKYSKLHPCPNLITIF